MTDLGFGLADRRSVIVVLCTFFLSSALFGNTIPVDTSTAAAVFVSLVALTGFIYLARTICRIVLALGLAVLTVPFIFYSTLKQKGESSESRQTITSAISQSFTENFVLPLLHWRDWQFRQPDGLELRQLGILGMIDRALLVLVALASTLPSLSSLRQSLGLIGVTLLILVYTFTGGFTFALKDAFDKAEDERKELVHAANNPKFPSSIYTEPKPRDYG